MAAYLFNTNVSVQVYGIDGLQAWTFTAGQHEVADADIEVLAQYAGHCFTAADGKRVEAPALSAAVSTAAPAATDPAAEAVSTDTKAEDA